MSLLEMKEMSRRKFMHSFTAAAAVAATTPLFSGLLAATAPLSTVEEIADLLFSRERRK